MRLSELSLERDEVLVKDFEFIRMNYCTSDESVPFLTFLNREKFIPRMNRNAVCIIVKEEMIEDLPDFVKGIIISSNPKYTFHRVFNEIQEHYKDKWKTRISSTSFISPLAYISPNNVVIGDRAIIEPFAVVHDNSKICNDCIVRSHAVIGGRSFSFARSDSGKMSNLPNLGRVILDEGVEIMSQTHVAQGIWRDDVTFIGRNTKIDAECHIGHGAKIGNAVLIAAGSVIGGNTVIGNNTWIGINATISNRIKIGCNARVNLGAVVTKNVPDGVSVSGNFAIEHERLISFIKGLVCSEA